MLQGTSYEHFVQDNSYDFQSCIPNGASLLEDDHFRFFCETPIDRDLWQTVLAKPTSHVELSEEAIPPTAVHDAPSGMLKFSFGRRLLLTSSGNIGLAPSRAAPGDLVVVLLGAPVPHVLRKRDDGGYTLVGECYVHGIMAGEALAHLDLSSMGHRCRPFPKSKSSAQLETFKIV